jgi:hypothetical protein
MRVPEYQNPIRVQWYRVGDSAPALEGSSDYVSSNWDDDRTFNPPVGEQSTMRDPFRDWVDCTPPPWPFCANCPLGHWPLLYLLFNGVLNRDCNCAPLRQVIPLFYGGLCNWKSASLAFCSKPTVIFSLTVGVGGQVTLILGRGVAALAEWAVNAGWDCYTLPLSLPLVASISTDCTWPSAVTLIPKAF